jgi:uncharacterized membrane protein YeaQ/YmgE (transglycosylase-associated protein family)
MTIIGFILFLIVAAVCAWIAEYFVPGRIPGGFFTAAVIGIIGGWIGANLLGSLGPSLEGVALIPTIIGSAILVFVLAILSKTLRGAKV